MAVQIPGAGTPIDSALLGAMAQEINRLAGLLSNSSKKSSVHSPGAGGTSTEVLTSELGIEAKYKDISVDTARQLDVAVQFEGFSKTPVVTATPTNRNNGAAGPKPRVVATSVTNKAATFRIYFDGSGKFNGYLNVIAVGIPQGVV